MTFTDTQRIRLLAILGSIALVAAIGFMSIGTFTQASVREGAEDLPQEDNSTQNNSRSTLDVVLLICAPAYNDNPPTPPILVVASSSSENAPVIAGGSDCAQSLSDLMNDGFFMKDVQPQGLNEGGGSYTLLCNLTG